MRTKLYLCSFICLIVSVLSSCTFEKRMYRPGYRIQWKHQIPKEKEEKLVNLDESAKKDQVQDEQVNQQEKPNVNLHPLVEIEVVEQVTKTQQVDLPTPIVVAEPIDEINALESQNDKTIEEQKIESDINKRDSDRGVGRGIYVLLVALLLAGLGYIFLLFLGAFGLIFSIVFFIFAGILVIYGLILIILAL